MSSEGENPKDLSTEVDKSSIDNVDENSSEDSQDKDIKSENEEEKVGDKSEVDEKIAPEKPAEGIEKKETDGKKDTKGEKEEEVQDKEKNEDENNESKTDNDTEEGEESGKEDESGKKVDKKGVPLLDQPLEQSGTRERKKVQRFTEDKAAIAAAAAVEGKEAKTEIPSGSGTQLGEIPRIDASISRFKNDDLKLLHRLLYKTPGKTTLIKKNIKKFNGFDFKKDTEEHTKKIDSAKKFELKQLKSICEMLDLEKKGSKDEIVMRVMEFLMEPKDSGKPIGGGRPKRTAAVRANNRGYSSHDDSYSSDERRASRGGRGKGRRTNLKDDSTSESDEEFHPSDTSDSKPRVVKRKRTGRKKVVSEDEIDDNNEEDGSNAESATSDESDDEPRKRKKTPKKVVNNTKAKGKVAPRGRGRKPAVETEKKATTAKKVGRKRDRGSSEESEAQAEDNASSSEDEPLIKKAKSPEPPTDEEIKKYVKEILDGANLEEITMKTVCKQVYAHYPDFDLAHKKDFIKSTVKSLIST